jgi:thiol-disulfide isomerase/thioredoxin
MTRTTWMALARAQWVGFGLMAVVALIGPGRAAAQEGDRIYLPIGSEAPGIEGVAIDGTFYSLTEMLAEGPVFLIFWNDPCGHNPAAIPLMDAITDAYQGKARLLGVVVSSVEGAKVWQEDFQPRHPVVVDPPGKWVDAYEMVYSVVPVKVGTDGRIADIFDGYGLRELQRLNEAMAAVAGLPAADVDLSEAVERHPFYG